jgi:hypothetical protein
VDKKTEAKLKQRSVYSKVSKIVRKSLKEGVQVAVFVKSFLSIFGKLSPKFWIKLSSSFG